MNRLMTLLNLFAAMTAACGTLSALGAVLAVVAFEFACPSAWKDDSAKSPAP